MGGVFDWANAVGVASTRDQHDRRRVGMPIESQARVFVLGAGGSDAAPACGSRVVEAATSQPAEQSKTLNTRFSGTSEFRGSFDNEEVP